MSEHGFETNFDGVAETLPLNLEGLIFTGVRKKATVLEIARKIPVGMTI